MDRRTLLAIALCFMIFFGWQKLYVEPRMPHPSATAPLAAPPSAADPAVGAPPAGTGSPVVPSAAVLRPAQTITLSTRAGDAVIGDRGRFFVGWNLKSYRLGISEKTDAVGLNSVTQQTDGEGQLAFDDPAFAYLDTVQGKLTKTPAGVRWSYEDANIKLTREFTSAPEQVYLDMQVTAEFKAKRPNFAFLSLVAQSFEKDPEAADRSLVYWSNRSLERVRLQKGVELKDVPTPVKYIAAADRYFLFTLVAQAGPAEPKGLVQPLENQKGRISLVYPVSGNSITIPVRAYFGPKEIDVLRAVDPALDNTVDFGWFTLFAYPILKLLKVLHDFIGNYGVAIIVLTLLLKLLTFPLTYKSMKSMKQMAKLQPQLAKIREKHKDDKEALNREMLTMMRSHGYNPAAGCLPMLVQMPIFFALYRVLYSSVDLYHAPFALWIQDLAAKDPFYITPVVLSGTMFLQQKLTPNTATDPAQARMMQMMPLIFGAFMIALPSGLTLYMLTNALASIVQQIILNKKFDAAPVARANAR